MTTRPISRYTDEELRDRIQRNVSRMHAPGISEDEYEALGLDTENCRDILDERAQGDPED